MREWMLKVMDELQIEQVPWRCPTSEMLSSLIHPNVKSIESSFWLIFYKQRWDFCGSGVSHFLQYAQLPTCSCSHWMSIAIPFLISDDPRISMVHYYVMVMALNVISSWLDIILLQKETAWYICNKNITCRSSNNVWKLPHPSACFVC